MCRARRHYGFKDESNWGKRRSCLWESERFGRVKGNRITCKLWFGAEVSLDIVIVTNQRNKIWAKATSITGTGAEAKPHALQVPLDLDGTIVKPGDLVFSDPTNGVIVIPQEKVADVLELLPQLIEADDRVKEDVLKGMSVHEAFKKHRG